MEDNFSNTFNSLKSKSHIWLVFEKPKKKHRKHRSILPPQTFSKAEDKRVKQKETEKLFSET